MRIRKYRAWSPRMKKMLGWDIVSGMNAETLLTESAENVPLEFTGLFDKNGKEIYEGDILQSEYTNLGDKEPRCHPVVWGNGRWNCDHSITGCCKPWRGDLNGHHQGEVIIGNIYENPELLTSK